MAGRSETPGLCRVKRRKGPPTLYWRAASLTAAPKGYPDANIRLPASASPEELRALCEHYTARLDAWLNLGPRGKRYDGTFRGLCDIFEAHPESPK